MAEGRGNANEIEPSFNIDDLMEFLPDDAMGATNIGMEKEGVLGSSSDVNNLNQENKLVNLEKYQVAATRSDIVPPISQNWKPMDTASDKSINSQAHILQRSTSPSIYTEFSQSQTSCNIISQSHQHQQLQNQFHNQTAQTPNIQPLSAQFNIYQQQQPLQQKQNTAFVLQKQQQKIGYHLDSSTMKHHEQFNVLKHHGQMTSEKSLQQIPTPMQMWHSLETPSDTGTNGVQPKLLTSAFPHSQNPMLVDQQKPVEQLQTAFLGLLQELESSSQFMLKNSPDWVDPVFKRIQLMNSMYFSEVFTLYQRASESFRQATSAESATRSEKIQFLYLKIIKFLQMPKTELMQHRKEIVYQFIKEIVLYLKRIRIKNPLPLQHHHLKASGNPSRTPSLLQKGNILQFNQVNPLHNNVPTSVPQLLMQQSNLNLQGSSTNQFQVGSSTGMQKSDPSSLMNSFQHNPMKCRQQYSPSQAHQGMSLPHKGSQIGFEHRASGLLPPSSVGISQHNTTLSTQQMGNSSPGNSFNNLDFTMRPLSQNPIVTVSPYNRQQDQHLTMQKKLKQPMQQMLTERNKQQMVQKMNEDAKMAQFAEFNQRMLVKHHSLGQHLEQYPWATHQLSSTSYRVASPQSSQYSSTQIEMKDLSSKLSRSTTPFLSTASPSAVPSPLTPVTPSSVPTDQEKIPICSSTLSVEERNKVTKAPIEPSLLQSRGISKNQVSVSVTQEFPMSPLLTESACPVDHQQSHAKADPVQRLVEVVNTMSQKALHAAVRDINAVTCIIDRKSGSLLQGGSRWVIGQDLADDTRSWEQGNFDLSCMKTRMKRRLRDIAADDMTSAFTRCANFEGGQISEVEFNATSRIKKLKKEVFCENSGMFLLSHTQEKKFYHFCSSLDAHHLLVSSHPSFIAFIQSNDMLLEEIREINHKLIETVVDVVNVKDVSWEVPAEGTIIRCLYNAVQCNGNINMLNASTQMFSNLIVELLVTADYPNSSPVVLERLPPSCSEAEEVKVLWTKVKSDFSLLLRKCSQPISLKEMAKTWDVCAREVFREFVQKFGGEDYSLRWKFANIRNSEHQWLLLVKMGANNRINFSYKES
ncbi:unnamed protein product [Fraxinus pennsylvanica]|uniref:Uncharacterized protein n=1 Tax=Fraxinus pennsylvanica TaxID=56036 RepID=A0AAD2AAL0_9LAMI|nr:unnamed protein product [Fraxinus pennsylvanica]